MYQGNAHLIREGAYAVYQCKDCEWREVHIISLDDHHTHIFKRPTKCPRCGAPKQRLEDIFEI